MKTTHTPEFVTVESVLPPMVLRGVARDLLAERDRLLAVNAELVAALEELVLRCDGEEGVRADGSNIQTMRAHAILEKIGGEHE